MQKGLVVSCLLLLWVSFSCKTSDSVSMVDGGHQTDNYPAVIEIFPVSFSYYEADIQSCTAIVLSDRTILTASHCLYGDAVMANIPSKDGSLPQSIETKKNPEAGILEHLYYPYDIGLAFFPEGTFGEEYLTKKMKFVSYHPKNNDTVRLVGYGFYDEGIKSLGISKYDSSKSHVKRVAWNKLSDRNACSKGMLEIYRGDVKNSKGVEKDPENYYRGTLTGGDSGGPLIRDASYDIIGVASYAGTKLIGSIISYSCYAPINLDKNLEFLKNTLREKDPQVELMLEGVTPLSVDDFVFSK